MHVKYSSRLTKMIVGIAFFFLAILLLLTLTDYGSRGWYASSRGTTTAGTQVTVTGPNQARRPVRRGSRSRSARPGSEHLSEVAPQPLAARSGTGANAIPRA
jgi:hypothetical protein